MNLSDYILDKIIEQVAADDDEMQEVRLSGKNIGDDGLTWLADALSSNSYVESLHLSKNDIGPEGVEALADCRRHTII
jgi:Ran GTPase-activating protein (RanGAP) involved in mRNA processing and transport